MLNFTVSKYSTHEDKRYTPNSIMTQTHGESVRWVMKMLVTLKYLILFPLIPFFFKVTSSSARSLHYSYQTVNNHLTSEVHPPTQFEEEISDPKLLPDCVFS